MTVVREMNSVKPSPFTAGPLFPTRRYLSLNALLASESLPETVNMQLAGPDLMVSKFQADVIAVTKNVFPEATLQRAATQLLQAWPFLSFQTNAIVGTQ